MATVKPNLVDQVQRDIAAGDLSRAYCVEAAAGTGKTTLLVERLLSIVRTDSAELQNVVAITFTEKAAAELKVRLREQLEQHRREASGKEREYLSRAVEQLDRANISTIHAFASALLRERPVEAGVDPGFEQLDEMGSQLLFDDVWRTWKERQFELAPPILRRLLTLEIDLETIKHAAACLLEYRDVPLSATVPAASPVNDLWRQITAHVCELNALTRHCLNESDRGFQQIQRLSRVVEQTTADEFDRERAILFELKVDATRGSQGNWEPASACFDQKQICAQLREIIDAAPQRLGPSLASGVLEWLRGFLSAVEQEKRARGVLDFQDLLLKARDLVRNHPEVRTWFQQRMRYLLVDEFQDTDPLQAELVFFLAEDGAVATDWRQVRLAPDKLFLVGDPKQSIYRFRRADIQVYGQARQMMNARHEPLTIRQNFRSSPWLLCAINDLFAPQMVEDDYQARYVPLEPAPGRPNAGPGLALLFPSDSYEPGKMAEYSQAEAELIARFLRSVCEAENPVRVWDKHTRQSRRARFGDIAVLLPVTTALAYYEDALRACGLPFQVEAGRQFYTRRETRSLISVLRAIDDPEDAIAVVAALRSPFFGLSDEDLFLYHHAGGRFQYLRTPKSDHPRVTHSLGDLRRWHHRRALVPLSSLVDEVLDESAALQFFLLLAEGEQAVANLLRIVQLARQFETYPGACLRSFVDWLEQREATELAEPDTPFIDEQEDAIRVLTIHAAKGLEFPIVALAGMACSRRSSEDFLVDHTSGQIGLSLKCGDHRLNTDNFDELAEVEHNRGRAEDLRLFYVAATRARDCLVIPRVAPENPRNPRFLDFFTQLDAYEPKPKQTTSTEGVLLVRAEDLPVVGAQGPVLRRNVGAVSSTDELVAPILDERRHWRNRLAEAGLCPATTMEHPASAERSGHGEHLSSEAQWRVGATARALGTAFHRIMHQVELEGDALLDVIIRDQADAADIPQHTATLKDWVMRALDSPLLARARKANRLWREVPFCITHDGQQIEGYIDLLFEEPGGLILVDYKTEEVAPLFLASAVDFHRPQLEVYRAAVEQFSGRPPRELLLYFVRPGIIQPVPISAKGEDALQL